MEKYSRSFAGGCLSLFLFAGMIAPHCASAGEEEGPKTLVQHQRQQVKAQLLADEVDEEAALAGLEKLAGTQTKDNSWADADEFYEPLIGKVAKGPLRNSLLASWARAKMARYQTPAALLSADDPQLRKQAEAITGKIAKPLAASVKAITVRSSAKSPADGSQPASAIAGALLDAYENVKEQWKAMGLVSRPEEAVSFYRAVLSDPCTKEQAISIQTNLLPAWLLATKDTPEACVQLFKLAQKEGHVSNRGWIAFGTVQAAHQAGHRKVVPVLIESLKDKPIGPDVKRALLLLGAISYFAEAEHEKARKGFLLWLKRYPKRPGRDKVLLMVAWSYFASGDNVNALKWFERLVKDYPHSRPALRARGFITHLHRPPPEPLIEIW